MSELDLKTLANKYLSEGRIMQLATSRDNKPWACNLHMATDDKANVYWISKPTRRHSEDIASNPNVAMTIAIKTDKPLIGIQIEGTAAVVADSDTIRVAMGDWMRRHGGSEKFIESIVDGSNEHKLYQMTPQAVQLFDEVNFPDSPMQAYNSLIK
jgi:uncharacterized protein YhbP (UPF0306 family)